MKLELLTNATVVNDAIRFVASHSASTGKGNSDKIVIVDNKNHSYEIQQLPTTNNSIF